MRRRFVASFAALLGLAGSATLAFGLTLFAPGCGDVGVQPGEDGGTGTVVVTHPDAAPLPGESECTVTETTGITVTSAHHIEDCAPVKYATNPPSGGDHWPFWAAFKNYAEPVPREMYVHDLEHGAAVLAFKCKGECPEVVAALQGVAAQLVDPLCLTTPGGPAARVIVTPDPLLAHPIAVAAWGATYTATCIDEASLSKFVQQAYGHGPEQVCANGKDIEQGFSPCGVPTDPGDAGSDAADGSDGADDDGGS